MYFTKKLSASARENEKKPRKIFTLKLLNFCTIFTVEYHSTLLKSNRDSVKTLYSPLFLRKRFVMFGGFKVTISMAELSNIFM